jgi:F0F1-type ATP synthase assembly protein I
VSEFAILVGLIIGCLVGRIIGDLVWFIADWWRHRG